MFLSSIIRNNKTETNQISINYRTDKRKVIYLYNEILLHSKKGSTDISYDVIILITLCWVKVRHKSLPIVWFHLHKISKKTISRKLYIYPNTHTCILKNGWILGHVSYKPIKVPAWKKKKPSILYILFCIMLFSCSKL